MSSSSTDRQTDTRTDSLGYLEEGTVSEYPESRRPPRPRRPTRRCGARCRAERHVVYSFLYQKKENMGYLLFETVQKFRTFMLVLGNFSDILS